MPKNSIYMALIAMIFLGSCGDNANEKIETFINGDFKVELRSREFNNSGIYNIDICVANTASHGFPNSKIQCFFAGYDLSDLDVKWLSKDEIQVGFSCGRVSYFNNHAVVSSDSHPPSQFHISLVDGCGG